MPSLEIPTDDPRPRLYYPLHETVLHKIIIWLLRCLFRLFADMQVSGAENVPLQGAAVVAVNHLVIFDVFPVQLALPRMLFYMGKAELFQSGIIHWFFRMMGGFPVFRGERDAWAINQAKRILASGQIVAMFPEGTRSGGKGLALARPGAAKLAIEMGCPLIVISVDGIQNLFKDFPRRAVIKVIIAPMITPKKNDGPIALTDSLMFLMAKNLPPELRGVYSENPKGF